MHDGIFFSSNVQGKLLNTFMREMTVVGDAFGGMARFFASILQMILFLGVPLYISWRVTLVSIVVGGLLSLPFLLFSKLSYRLGKLNTSTSNKFSKIIQENLSSAKVVLGFANQDNSKEMLGHAFDAHLRGYSQVPNSSYCNTIDVLSSGFVDVNSCSIYGTEACGSFV